MNLKTKIKTQVERTGIKWEIIEQDYILSWILAGISQEPTLKENLVFKGGTALKKCYFGDYRFSQDGDFSVREGFSPDKDMIFLMDDACRYATKMVQEMGENVEFTCNPYQEKRPHPEGQLAFIILARLPWHREPHTKVYIEISLQELVIMEPVLRKIIHHYGEPLEQSLYVYPLEEIFCEKIRALLQFAKKLHERGWGRSRVRDYYDLWSILKTYHDHLNFEILPNVVRQKCQHKNVEYNGYAEIFQEKLMLNMNKEWDSWLKDVVPSVPDKEMLLEYLKNELGKINGL